MRKYQEGSVIVYTAFGGLRRTVLVEEKEADVKNGRPGFSGVLVDQTTLEPLEGGLREGNGVWGYDYQIIRVLRH